MIVADCNIRKLGLASHQIVRILSIEVILLLQSLFSCLVLSFLSPLDLLSLPIRPLHNVRVAPILVQPSFSLPEFL